MNIQLFQKVAEYLLQAHFGVALNDTRLSEVEYVKLLVEGDVRPFAYLNQHAEERGLDRVDLTESCGMVISSKKDLLVTDELNAIAQLNSIRALDETPTTCPCCGRSTNFEVFLSSLQHHRCPGPDCGFEFICAEEWGDEGQDLRGNEAEIADLLQNGVTDYCFQVCGGGECGTGKACQYGIDPNTHMPVVAEEKAAELNDRFADSIIGDRIHDYDGLEIQGVRDLHAKDDPKGTCCEIDNENPQFFSVYVHICSNGERGGVECIGDFGTHTLAAEYAKELSKKYNWTINDYVKAKFN